MKIIYIGVGFVSFVLGAIGIFIPILPTVPFLLVSSFCFAKGSERINNWFLSTTVYQKYLESFAKDKSMLLKTKVIILAFASMMLLIVFFMMSNIYGRITIALLIAFKYYYFIFKIKTIKEEKEDE